MSEALRAFIAAHPRLTVLTGAGISTDSGIPAYRGREGEWLRAPPLTLQAFMADEAVRRRYWARSAVGWPRVAAARPNSAHDALERLEGAGRLQRLVTQNVDGLHQAAGNTRVIDLHGRIDSVRCMQCGARSARAQMQARLLELNPFLEALTARTAPDGDADLEIDAAAVQLPACEHCGGILKPDVVLFGENVPPERVQAAMAAVEASDALLVVGSSLMVYSGYRFVQRARSAGKPVAAVNLGRTRADEELALKVEAPCAEALAFLLRADPPGDARRA